MGTAILANELKNWLTIAAIVVAGIWALWRFGHAEWLRRRSEIPCLEGNTARPEILEISEVSAIVSLRWTWRNAGNRPVYIDTAASRVEVYELPANMEGIIDPRQNEAALRPHSVARHTPLGGMREYMFEPGTNSSLLTPVILPSKKTYLARIVLYVDPEKHRSINEQGSFWERWQVFRTDIQAAD
jgi:hypothetical protein